MIKIYNTLKRKKEEFIPIDRGRVKMYVCGPTVYDAPHIGHARSSCVFDVVRRYFEYSGLKVRFVRNVTDVDDKIINKASLELKESGEEVSSGGLKEKVREVSVRYLETYHREMDLMGIRQPTVEPKATENIPGMIKFIQVLVDKGYAYVSGKNVYFDVDKAASYGKLSNQDKEQMMHAVRVDPDENKRHALDFALWKEAGSCEPSWQSPWGEGRPGWHIECSVMSTSMLGACFDIHGGGLDLIFPHHENEIAQAEAATGGSFANYWMHNGLLTVRGEKMSKSLGNYITISDFLSEYRDPDLLKIAFLWSHYRSPMDYSAEKIEEAGRSKERIMIFFDKVDRLTKKPRSVKDKAGALFNGDAVRKAQETANGLREKFNETMNDDFNTPAALSVVFEAVRYGNEYLASEESEESEKIRVLGVLKNQILRLGYVLGLSLSRVKSGDKDTGEIERMVSLREQARKRKDYGESDRIRGELMSKGIIVEDTPEGPVWRRA